MWLLVQSLELAILERISIMACLSVPAQHIADISGRQVTDNEFAQASNVIDHTAGKHRVLFLW